MYYTNSMKLTLKNEETASLALEIMKTRLAAGFDCDKDYRRSPSSQMRDELEVVGNDIILPEDCGYYTPIDANEIMSELIQLLAEQVGSEDFSFGIVSCSDYDEGWIDGSCVSGQLKIRTTYLPSGFGSFYCQECDEVVATMEDDAEGNLYITVNDHTCPACGNEADLSDWLPIISEKTIKVI